MSVLPETKEGVSFNPACYSVKELEGGGRVVEAEEIRESGKTEKR